MLAYRLLQRFLRLVVSVFFRNIEIVGEEHIPLEGGVIFAGNHPNSLMDPMMVITQSGRVVHFAAKDVLFHSRFLRFFLNILGAVPIKRKKDHKGKKFDNDQAFNALGKVLKAGRCMGIFPEGISHSGSEIAQIKTGAARIAFSVNANKNAQDEHVPISIVPVGLTFLSRQRVRSQVLLHFGEPIVIDQEKQQQFAEDPRAVSRALTDELEQRIRSLTINAPDWDTLRMLHTARRLYKPQDQKLDLATYSELTRRFVKGYLKHQDQYELKKLRAGLELYQDLLQELQLRDHDLRKPFTLWSALKRIFGRLTYMTILFPLALPGFLLHSPLILTAVLAGDGLTPRKNVVATTKLIVALLIVPLLYLTIAFSISHYYSPLHGFMILCILPLTGFATIRVLEQKFALGKSLHALSKLLRFRKQIEVTRELRIELEQQVHNAVEQFHNPDIPRMFYAEDEKEKETETEEVKETEENQPSNVHNEKEA